MFGLFGNKNKKIKTASRIGMTREAALADLVKHVKEEKGACFVFYFFDDSRDTVKQLLEKENISVHESSGNVPGVYLLNARKINPILLSLSSVTSVYCIDHYPLHTVFESFTNALTQTNPALLLITYGGLDEPIFNAFGGDRIKELMLKIGMQETELIEHSMISKALENAKEKIEKKVVTESHAYSAAEWFKKNLPQDL